MYDNGQTLQFLWVHRQRKWDYNIYIYDMICHISGSICGHFVSRLCFVKLKLLLLAVEERTGEGEAGDTQISINPRYITSYHHSGYIICHVVCKLNICRDFQIAPCTVGFFIAQSAEEVKRYLAWRQLTDSFKLTLNFLRAWFYCKSCHEKVRNENLIRRCKCRLSE